MTVTEIMEQAQTLSFQERKLLVKLLVDTLPTMVITPVEDGNLPAHHGRHPRPPW